MSAPDVAEAIERLTDAVLTALTHEAPTAAAVRFLIRQYAATGRDDIRDGLEPALTRSLDVWQDAPHDDRPGWLMLFGEAAAVSDDDRVREAALGLARSVEAAWGRERRVAIAAAGVDACLRMDISSDLVQRAIDELERLVALAYQPGEGLTGPAGGGPRLADHVTTAGALLTAFERTGRLPYSMLAEELVQFAARTFAADGAAGFTDGDTGGRPFALNCEAASVLCRLAALHASDAYRTVAVFAAGADYGRDAERILRWLAPAAPDLGQAGAVYGLAASDCRPVL